MIVVAGLISRKSFSRCSMRLYNEAVNDRTSSPQQHFNSWSNEFTMLFT